MKTLQTLKSRQLREIEAEDLARVTGGWEEDYIVDTNDDSGYEIDPFDDGSGNITIWTYGE